MTGKHVFGDTSGWTGHLATRLGCLSGVEEGDLLVDRAPRDLRRRVQRHAAAHHGRREVAQLQPRGLARAGRHSEDQARVSGRAWSTGLLRAKRAVERLSSAGRRYLAREQLRGGGGVAVEVVIEPVPREEHLARRVERMALEVVDAE